MSIRIVLPEIELSEACEQAGLPNGATLTKPGEVDDELCGAVHPAGITSRSWAPEL